MKPDEIHLSDWMRIMFGQAPATFYIELIIRCFLVYLLLMISMRLMGKRMAGQLSRLDLAAMVALASSIGVPMLSPVNGILPAFIIAIVIVVISRFISYISLKSEKVENITQGNIDTLVMDGTMNLNVMKKVRITRERLFAELRSSEVIQLGQVNRMYMEADGNFSLILNKKAEPGLMVLPDWDTEFIDEKLSRSDTSICSTCGKMKPQPEPEVRKNIVCDNCGSQKWAPAVEEKKKKTSAATS